MVWTMAIAPQDGLGGPEQARKEYFKNVSCFSDTQKCYAVWWWIVVAEATALTQPKSNDNDEKLPCEDSNKRKAKGKELLFLNSDTPHTT